MRIAALGCLLIAAGSVAWLWMQGRDAKVDVPDSAAVAMDHEGPRVMPRELSRGGIASKVDVASERRSPATRALAGPSLEIRARDALGRWIEGAQLFVASHDQATLPERSEREWVCKILNVNKDMYVIDVRGEPMEGGQITLPYGDGEWVALVVRAKGYRSVARAYAAGAVPAHVDLVMRGSGQLRGKVVGGRAKHSKVGVRVWPANEELADAEASGSLFGLYVGHDGTFVDKSMEPGAYRVALNYRSSRAASRRSDEVALVDEGQGLRDWVEFVIHAGRETYLELVPPRFGVLRGRVLLFGQPVSSPSIRVMAARPEEPILGVLDDSADWDESHVWQRALSQQTVDDGSFQLLYAKAGPVELRVRHPDGHATSEPLVVTLPPPGSSDVVCDLVVPTGKVWGRVELEARHGRVPPVTIALYPMRRVAEDPTFRGGSFPLLTACAAVRFTPTGEFAFHYLPAGEWLLRAHSAGRSEVLWQRVVNVSDGLVDLGTIAPVPPVSVALAYGRDLGIAAKQDRPTNFAFRLFQPHDGNPTALWAATLHGLYGSANCAKVLPGSYNLVPFEYTTSGEHLMATPFAKPVPIEIRSDGSVLPNPVRFSPLPPPAKPVDHK